MNLNKLINMYTTLDRTTIKWLKVKHDIITYMLIKCNIKDETYEQHRAIYNRCKKLLEDDEEIILNILKEE